MSDIDRSFTISEASEMIGYPNHVLRFYEKEFELEIPRNKSGHRYYTYMEIEKFTYIKTLKERGLSNKQIKTILSSPEEIMNFDEVAAASYAFNTDIGNNVIPVNNSELEISNGIVEIGKMIQEKLDDNFDCLSKSLIGEMRGTINELKQEYTNQDKDTLISENARLRMKLKERAYETATLRDKLKRYESKGSIFKKLFGASSKEI